MARKSFTEGVALLFYGKDKGAQKTADEVGRSLDRLATSAVDAGTRGADGIRDIGDAISGLNQTTIHESTSAIEGLGGTASRAAKSGLELGNAIEPLDVGFDFCAEAARGFSEELVSLDGQMGSVADSAEHAEELLGVFSNTTGRIPGVAAAAASGIKDAGEEVNGAGDKSNETAEVLDRLRDSLEDLKRVDLSDLATAFHLDEISSGLNVSSSSLESWGAQFSQTYRQATAGMGEFRGAVDEVRGEIAGVSHSLQVGAEGMLAYARNAARAGHRVDDFGLSMRAVAGLEQAGIIGGEELSALLTDLSNSYDLGAEGATRLANRMVALGEGFGFGADALRQMPAAMGAIGPVARVLGWTGDQASTAAESIMRLAMANNSLGGSPQQNFESAVATFSQLGESRRDMSQLLSGLEGQFPALAQSLGVAIGDTGQAFDALMLDPVRFAQSVREMYQNASDPNEQQRLRTVMEGLGEQFGWLAQGSDDVGAALERALGPIENVANAVERLGRSAGGSARTFSEQMDLVTERFQTHLNTMVRGMPGYENFERRVLERQTAAYGRLEDRIESFTGGSGVLAGLGRAALAARRGGLNGMTFAIQTELGGAFPGLEEHLETTIPLIADLGSGALEFASDAAPMLIALNQMGVRLPRLGTSLGLLLNPITLLAGAMVYLAVRGDKAEEDLARLSETMERGAVSAATWSSEMLEAVQGVDWEKIGSDIIGGLVGIFDSDAAQTQTAQAISKLFRNIGSAVTTVVGETVRGMWDRSAAGTIGLALGGGLVAVMASPFRGAFLKGIRGIFRHGKWLVKGISSIFRSLRGIGGAIGLAGGARALAGPALRAVLRGLPVIGTVIGVLFDLPQIIRDFEAEGIGEGFFTLFSSIANSVLLGIPRLLGGADILGDVVETLFQFSGFGRILDLIDEGYWASAIAESLFGIFNGPFLGIPNIIREAIEQNTGTDIFSGLIDPLARGIESLVDWVSAGGPMDLLARGFEILGEAADFAWSVIGPVISIMGDALGRLWSEVLVPIADLVGDALVVSFEGLRDGAYLAFQAISGAGKWFLDEVVNPLLSFFGMEEISDWVAAFDSVVAAFHAIGEAGLWLWNSVLVPLLGFFVGQWVDSIVSAVSIVVTVLRTVGGILWWVWDNVARPVLGFFVGQWVDGLVSAANLVVGALRIIGSVMWWIWENVTAPVLGFIYRGWSQFFDVVSGQFSATWTDLGILLTGLWRDIGEIATWVWAMFRDGLRVIWGVIQKFGSWISGTFSAIWTDLGILATGLWRDIGEIAMWVWTEALEPGIDWLIGAWGTVQEVASRVWNAIADYVVGNIRNAIAAVLFLQQNWERAKTIMVAGFRLIGAEINEFLLSPFLQVQGVIGEMGYQMRIVFYSVKQTVLGMLVSLLSGFETILRAIGETSAAAAVGGWVGSMNEGIDEARESEDRVNRQRLAERSRIADEVAAAEAETALRREQLGASMVGVDALWADAQGRADYAMSGGDPDAAVRGARRAVEESASAVGAMGRPEGRAAPAASPSAVAGPAGATPSGGRRSGPAAGSRGAPRAPRPGAPGGGGGTPAAREAAAAGAREGRARDIARALEISRFGDEALRQLGRALQVRVNLPPRRSEG